MPLSPDEDSNEGMSLPDPLRADFIPRRSCLDEYPECFCEKFFLPCFARCFVPLSHGQNFRTGLDNGNDCKIVVNRASAAALDADNFEISGEDEGKINQAGTINNDFAFAWPDNG